MPGVVRDVWLVVAYIHVIAGVYVCMCEMLCIEGVLV